MCRDIVGECVTLAGKRHHLVNGEVQLVDQVPHGTFVVKGDREELVAAVTNLVDNAVKYSGDRVKVGVEVVRLGARRVGISVRDQGIGITRHELKRVFGGSIGCRRRCGRVSAAPASGSRSCGLSRVGMAVGCMPRVEGRTRQHLHARASAALIMSRILIVEDEEHLAAGLKLNLEAEGFAAESRRTDRSPWSG